MIRNIKSDDEEDCTNSANVGDVNKSDENASISGYHSRFNNKDNGARRKLLIPLIIVGCIVLCCMVLTFLLMNRSSREQGRITTDINKTIPKMSIDPKKSHSARRPAILPNVKDENLNDQPPILSKFLSESIVTEEATSLTSNDLRARTNSKGVLGMVADRAEAKSVASADIFGEGGLASDIDKVLSGIGSLKAGGSGGVGRKGVAGIGYGEGYGSGFGGSGTGGVDDLLSSLSNDKKKLSSKSPVSKPIQTWKRSGLTANTSKLSVGLNDSCLLKGCRLP